MPLCTPQMPVDALTMLRENILVDDAEAVLITESMASTQEIIAGIDANIQDLENKLLDLRKQRDAAAKTLACSMALLAPVRKLPPEILGKIFNYCVRAEPKHKTFFNSGHGPLLLMRVCHRWRQVVQGTPTLWNTIILRNLPRDAIFAPMWFDNSRAVPLDIDMHYFADHGREEVSNAYRYLQPACPPAPILDIARTIAKQFSRFRRFALKCPPQGPGWFLPTENTIATYLEEMYILSRYPPSATPWPSSIITPRLHTLTLFNTANILLPSLKCTSSLRQLTITRNCTLERLTNFISLCPALQRLDASFIDVERLENPIPTDLIILPDLSHLRLTITGDFDEFQRLEEENVELLAHRLRTPNLRVMELWNCNYTLSALLGNSHSSLRRLSISNAVLTIDTFRNSMGNLMEIEELELIDVRTLEGFWESMTPEEGTSPDIWIFPKLKRLRVAPESPSVSDEHAFVRFLERRTPPSSLRENHLSGESGYLYTVQIRLKEGHYSPHFYTALMELGTTQIQIE